MTVQPNSGLNLPNQHTLTMWVREKNRGNIKKTIEQILRNLDYIGKQNLIRVVKGIFLANPDYFMEEFYPDFHKTMCKNSSKDPIRIERQLFEDISLLKEEFIATEFWGTISCSNHRITGLITLTSHRVIAFGDLKPTAKAFMVWKGLLSQTKAAHEAQAIRQGVSALLKAPPCFGYCFPFTKPTNVTTSHNSLTYLHTLTTPGDFGWKSKNRTVKVQSKNFYGDGTLNQFRRIITRNEEIISLSRVINQCKYCGATIRRETAYCAQCGKPF